MMYRRIKRIWNIFKTKIIGIKSGKHSLVEDPIQIDNCKGIQIGDYVTVCKGSWLMGNKNAGNPSLVIDDKSVIGHFAHIVALCDVHIENDVLIADKVFISDCTHSYEDITQPIIEQEIKIIKPVIIGEGSWLGENVCVCGASIGKHCVIGANSVVTQDIPDYSVAVGSPARIIKKYDFKAHEWMRVN